ncbi:MAG: DUF4167 domain-containing protein [Alphaproteobacteria bacterium]|nr:DUF4167 domain-containing protein [Alphaproteobacteria bacterium]
MRQGPNGRRPRSRHHGGGGGGGENRGNGGGSGGGGNPARDNRPRSAASLRHQSFDSNCGDLRVRGNAWQVYEKYQALGRDAASAGDRVAAENYQQHAEHYFRIIEAINEATAAEQQRQGGAPRPAGQPYDQQPTVPTNYYNPDGTLAPPPAGSEPNGNMSGQPESASAEATVQSRTPPPQPSSFFTQEEVDEHNGDQPLTAVR